MPARVWGSPPAPPTPTEPAKTTLPEAALILLGAACAFGVGGGRIFRCFAPPRNLGLSSYTFARIPSEANACVDIAAFTARLKSYPDIGLAF